MAKSSPSSAEYVEETPAATSLYHPQAIRSLVSIKQKLLDLIAQVDAAIVADPPPYVAPPSVPAVTVHGSVRADSIDVFETPHVNAKVKGQIAQGAVLPIVRDPSTDEGYTWYKIVAGQYKGGFVQGTSLTLQAT